MLFTLSPLMWQKNVIFYHTRVFLYTCFVRGKENEIYCILEVIYIYIIYMLLYTHVLPQSCLIPWYRFTWKKKWRAFWSVCVNVHIYFLYGKISPPVGQLFNKCCTRRHVADAERTNNRIKHSLKCSPCPVLVCFVVVWRNCMDWLGLDSNHVIWLNISGFSEGSVAEMYEPLDRSTHWQLIRSTWRSCFTATDARQIFCSGLL